jgi:hypothetical protein
MNRDGSGGGCMMPDCCMSKDEAARPTADKSALIKRHLACVESHVFNLNSIGDLLKSINPDLRNTIEFHGLGCILHDQTNGILKALDGLEQLLRRAR